MITREQIKEYLKPTEWGGVSKIPLIKEYRAQYGTCLKDSKDAIEAALDKQGDRFKNMCDAFGIPDMPGHIFDARLKSAIIFAIDNYAVLGFTNAYNAVATVMNNFATTTCKETKMKQTYIVEFIKTNGEFCTMHVEAKNEEDAENIAWDQSTVNGKTDIVRIVDVSY